MCTHSLFPRQLASSLAVPSRKSYPNLHSRSHPSPRLTAPAFCWKASGDTRQLQRHPIPDKRIRSQVLIQLHYWRNCCCCCCCHCSFLLLLYYYCTCSTTFVLNTSIVIKVEPILIKQRRKFVLRRKAVHFPRWLSFSSDRKKWNVPHNSLACNTYTRKKASFVECIHYYE